MFHLLGLFLFCVSPGHNYYIYFSYIDDLKTILPPRLIAAFGFGKMFDVLG